MIPDRNPLKRLLVAMSAILPAVAPPGPLDDGRAPPMPDRDMLRKGMLAARTLLKELASHFDVDLFGNASAGRFTPVRPEPPTLLPREALRPAAPRRMVPQAPVPAKNAPPPQPRKPPPRRTSVAPVARRPERLPEPPPGIGSPKADGRSPIEPRPGAGGISSTAFWFLMDSWKVPDLKALDLIGHLGGLTKKGTRPRFKLDGEEVDMLRGLQEIDAALMPLGLDAALWLKEPVEGAPFEGSTPLAFLIRARIAGMRETIRYILQHGLRMSMAT